MLFDLKPSVKLAFANQAALQQLTRKPRQRQSIRHIGVMPLPVASCESVSDAESGETALNGGGVEALAFLGDVAGQFMGVGGDIATPFAEGTQVGLVGPPGVLRMRLPDQLPNGFGKLVFPPPGPM